jgi:NitT/TauT family transport system substrate-binding protein
MKHFMPKCSAKVILVALLFLAWLQIPAAFAAEKIRIVFPTTPTTLFLPYFVAQKKNWLGDLNIEELYVTGDSNAVRAVLSGNADLGAGIGTFAVLSAIEAGATLKAIGSWQPLGDYNMVIAEGKGTTIADLAGKIIATSGPGALPDQLPRILMRKHGVDLSTTRFVQVGGHPARLQAVLGGRADAALVNTATSLDAVKAGRVHLVAKIAQEFPMLGYVWNVARVSTLDDPELRTAIQDLTTAGIRGARFIVENPEEAANILHEKVPELDPKIISGIVRDLDNDNVWGVEGGLDPKIIDFTVKTGVDLGLLKQPIESYAVVDDRFVNVAIRELGQAK